MVRRNTHANIIRLKNCTFRKRVKPEKKSKPTYRPEKKYLFIWGTANNAEMMFAYAVTVCTLHKLRLEEVPRHKASQSLLREARSSTSPLLLLSQLNSSYRLYTHIQRPIFLYAYPASQQAKYFCERLYSQQCSRMLSR